ncbi:MFS transporter [Catenulispora sp. GP43]|uniref:MFS transporter n=1 Tax=Catenulispora sp. GP43 TaxID=3156263 RepID=UPI0035113D24
MVILDSAIVNVALPAIQDRLAFTATGLAWVVNGYLLTLAGLMFLGGRTADLFGHHRTLIAGLALFSTSSLVATLVTARITQRAGAALLAPATLAVITTTFTDEHTRARAFGAWSAAGGIGGMAGALAGGAITTGLSTHRESLDLAGAATGTASLAVTAPAVTGLCLLTVFVIVEGRLATHPMTPPRLFRTREVGVGTSMLTCSAASPSPCGTSPRCFCRTSSATAHWERASAKPPPQWSSS